MYVFYNNNIMEGLIKIIIIFNLCFAIDSLWIDNHGVPGDTCDMGEGVKGACEDIGKCLQTGGVIARRGGRVNVCFREFSTIYVCCRRPHIIARELCNAWRQFWKREDGRCDFDRPLIVGGENAHIGEFPHAVRFGKKFRNKINFDCGGTLISPHFVLTAAHCLFSYIENPSFWVKLGDHDINHDSTSEETQHLSQPLPDWIYNAHEVEFHERFTLANFTENNIAIEQVIEVDHEYIYPDYSHGIHYYHDIALLRLKEPVKFSRRVLPACLPHKFPSDDHVGQTLTAVGWGSTGRHQMSKVLQKVDLPVVDRLRCSTTKANNKKTPLGITQDMICAGTEDKDSCSGDSGGPLTTRRSRNSSSCEHTVMGVVSYGIGPGYLRCGFLGVYTRVSSYLDWITGIIAPNATGYIHKEDFGLHLFTRKGLSKASGLYSSRRWNANTTDDSKILSLKRQSKASSRYSFLRLRKARRWNANMTDYYESIRNRYPASEQVTNTDTTTQKSPEDFPIVFG